MITPVPIPPTNLSEHFCGFTDSNNEPYTTANTVSNHCREHLGCVQKLIKGLQPLSNAVNDYFNNTYPVLYAKMKRLDLGPNVPNHSELFPLLQSTLTPSANSIVI